MKLEELFPYEDIVEAERAQLLEDTFFPRQFTARELRDGYYTKRDKLERQIRRELKKSQTKVSKEEIEADKQKRVYEKPDPTPEEFEAFIQKLK